MSREQKQVLDNMRMVWADGHRFGPQLTCQHSGCIQSWFTQQLEPTKCQSKAKDETDNFTRKVWINPDLVPVLRSPIRIEVQGAALVQVPLLDAVVGDWLQFKTGMRQLKEITSDGPRTYSMVRMGHGFQKHRDGTGVTIAPDGKSLTRYSRHELRQFGVNCAWRGE